MKKQTNIAEKQYQKLDKIHVLNKTVLNKNCKNSDLVYNNFNFNKFSITNEEFNGLSDDPKYKHVKSFANKINELRKVKSRAVCRKKRKAIVSDAASNLFISRWEN